MQNITHDLYLVSFQCPTTCSCSDGLVDCAGLRLSTIPDPSFLPRGTQSLLLGMNNLERSDMRRVCSKQRELSKITLEHNEISEIRMEDFIGCSEVEELDLSYNNIATIDQDTFTGLSKLKKLKILGNFIICFDKKVLDKFDYILVIEIDLRFLECNCQSRWVLEW
jgi:hypothetical protein